MMQRNATGERLAHQRVAGRPRRAVRARSRGRAAGAGRGPRDRSRDGGRRPDPRPRPGPARRAGGQRGSRLARALRASPASISPPRFWRPSETRESDGVTDGRIERRNRTIHRSTAGLEPGPAGPGRLSAGGHRPQAGQRAPARRPARAAFRRFPAERDGDRRADGPGGDRRGRPHGARRRSRRPGGSFAPTRTWGSSCCSLRWRPFRRRSISPTGIEDVLAATTVDDARQVYRAIRLAQPGGLGEVSDQDVAREPTITLRDAMGLAAERDSIARQYANGFREVLVRSPARASRIAARGWPLETAIVVSYLQATGPAPGLVDRAQVWA